MQSRRASDRCPFGNRRTPSHFLLERIDFRCKQFKVLINLSGDQPCLLLLKTFPDDKDAVSGRGSTFAGWMVCDEFLQSGDGFVERRRQDNLILAVVRLKLLSQLPLGDLTLEGGQFELGFFVEVRTRRFGFHFDGSFGDVFELESQVVINDLNPQGANFCQQRIAGSQTSGQPIALCQRLLSTCVEGPCDLKAVRGRPVMSPENLVEPQPSQRESGLTLSRWRQPGCESLERRFDDRIVPGR